VGDTGRIVREVKIASEREALQQVLTNPICRRVPNIRFSMDVESRRVNIKSLKSWFLRDSKINAALIQGGERWRFAMAVLLRGDFDASRLRGLAKKTKDGPQARRRLALAAISEGTTRTEAAKIGGV
jgi:hypothetical protein